MTDDQAARDQRSLQRRLDVLQLPVVQLQRHGHVGLDRRGEWRETPEAVGVGPDGTALAVWEHRRIAGRKRITQHTAGGPASQVRLVNAVDLTSDLKISFVQPLPDGAVLLASARSRSGEPSAQVWGPGGDFVLDADLGDALEHLLTTATGRVWCGYFDEALGRDGPAGHGLARFGPDLRPEWLYPPDAGLPVIFDCYSLNVAGESAHCCPYADFPLLSVVGDRVTDLGAAPRRSTTGLLRQGRFGALIGGTSPEYDLVTVLAFGKDGVEPVGTPCRLVLPDGFETQHARYTCRGGDLHAFVGRQRFHLDLDRLVEAATAG